MPLQYALKEEDVVADREYKDCVAFIKTTKKDGTEKVFPRTVGQAFTKENGDVSVYLDTIPVHGWDGSFLIQPKRVKDDTTFP